MYLKQLIYENHFQAQALYNRLVWPPNQVTTNNGWIIYYEMNKKSINVTSYNW